MIVSLLLLCLAATATIEAQFTGKQIDFRFCEINAKCYLRKSCWKNYDKDNLLKMWRGEDAEDVDYLNCSAGFQLKAFNKDKIIIFFQVLNVERETDSLAVYYGSTLVVECKRNETDGVITVLGGSTGLTTISAGLYENISYFDEKNVLCALVIDNPDKIASALWNARSMEDRAMMRYTAKGGAQVVINFEERAPSMLTPLDVNLQCDPTLIQDGFPITGKHVLRVFDKGRVDQKLDCTNYKKTLGTQFEYKLFVNARDKPNLEVPKITCNISSWKIVWQFNKDEAQEYKQPFEAYCAADVTKTCSEPACASPPCPLFTPGTESAPAQLACPKDRWLIEGEFVEGQKASCEAHVLEQNSAAFYIITPKGARIELTNTSCFEKYDCSRHSSLDIAECAPDTVCEMATINEAANRLKCLKGQLTVSQGGNEATDTAEFECDYETGVWRGVGETTTFIPPHSRITCYIEREEEKPNMTNGQKIGYMVGGAVAAFVISSIVAFGVFHYIGKKNTMKKKISG